MPTLVSNNISAATDPEPEIVKLNEDDDDDDDDEDYHHDDNDNNDDDDDNEEEDDDEHIIPPSKSSGTKRRTSPSVEEDTAPAKKKSKSGRVVDAMMLASTVSSLSSSSASSTGMSAPRGEQKLHLLNVTNDAECWRFFKKYDLRFHPGKVNKAHCMLCGKSYSNKGNSTTSMNKHLKAKHRKVLEASRKTSTSSDSQATLSDIWPKKIKEKTPEEFKVELINASTNFVIEKNLAFTIVESPSFRDLFRPFHKDAAQITTITANRVREEIFERGALAKDATMLETADCKGSWTCDHWTGKDGATYTTTTFHYIKKWILRSIIVDFRVFHGTTSGEAIYNDQRNVLEEYTNLKNIVIGITDTTSSMGVLGQFLRNKGMQHAYCTDHVLHCNAILAFNGKCIETPYYDMFQAL